jgi:hypothetical protein
MTTNNTTNSLKHTIRTTTKEGNPMIINIRLSDDCNNGHADFAITGTVYRPFSRGDRKDADWKVFNDKNYTVESCGCIHEEILESRPDLKLFVDLHLSDSKGAPMYAVENGYYHLKNSSLKTAMEYLRLTYDEVNVLVSAEDKLHFTYLLHKLEIPARWKAEADKAIKILEMWNQKSFEDTSVKQNLTSLPEEQAKEIEGRLNKGYYSEEEKQKRVDQAKQAAKDKLIKQLTIERDKDIAKANNEFNVKMAVLNAGLPLDNFIYYTHSNEGCFNWLDFKKAVTPEEFEQFINTVDHSTLPEGFKFKLGKK